MGAVAGVLDPLLEACLHLLEATDEPMMAEFGPLLCDHIGGAPTAGQLGPFPLGRFPPIGRWATEQTQPIVAAVSAVQRDLDWFQSAAEMVPPGWRDRAAAVELIGPDGMFPNEPARFGLFFMMEDTFYPAHAHAAEEFYLVVAGSARWALDCESVGRQRPGDLVRTRTMVWHEIVTEDEPILALWGWSGDTSYDSYRY